MIRWITAPLLALAACGGTSNSPDPAAAPEPAAPQNEAPMAEAADSQDAPAGDEPLDFSDYDTLVKLTDEPVLSEGHKNTWVDLYVSADAEEVYRAGGSGYPEGARVVKVHYTDETATEIQKVPVMQKMAAGYDPEHNDWYYGVYNGDGTEAKMAGKLGKCMGCHEGADSGDYVFGPPDGAL